MIDWLSVTVSAILIGVISSTLWEWLRDSVSITSSVYIDLRGEWNIESALEQIDGSTLRFNEKLVVKQQFLKRFRGILSSHHPSDPKIMIELDVRGEFKDKFHVVYSYENQTSKLTDVGAGTFQIHPNHTTAEGATVNFGVSSPVSPSVIRFTMNKLGRNCS